MRLPVLVDIAPPRLAPLPGPRRQVALPGAHRVEEPFGVLSRGGFARRGPLALAATLRLGPLGRGAAVAIAGAVLRRAAARARVVLLRRGLRSLGAALPITLLVRVSAVGRPLRVGAPRLRLPPLRLVPGAAAPASRAPPRRSAA